MKKVLFWDFDGTLVHPNEAYSETLDRALRAYGYEIPFDEIRKCTRMIPWHKTDTVYPQPVGEPWWDGLYGRMRRFTEAWGITADIHTEICCRYREELKKYPYKLFEGAVETVDACRAMGYDCHLLSNNHPHLPEVLERMGLTAHFDKLFVGSIFGYDKPRPEFYRYAMAEAGEAAEAWMIGDNPHFDIKAAREAGLRTIWVNPRFAMDVGERYADRICRTLAEIPAALEQKLYYIEDNIIGLRQYTHADDRDMYRCWQDPDTQKGYNGIFDDTFEAFSDFEISRFRFWFTVMDKYTNTPAGTLRLGLDAVCPDLAVWIYAEFRRRGYGTGAFRLALAYIFANSDYTELSAGCYRDNTGSRKMLEQIGFVRFPEGDLEETDAFTGEPTVQLEYRISREQIL